MELGSGDPLEKCFVCYRTVTRLRNLNVTFSVLNYITSQQNSRGCNVNLLYLLVTTTKWALCQMLHP